MNKKTTFPTLYHKTSKGAINVWTVWAENDSIYTEWGQKDGKLQLSCKKVEQKNLGKKNETSLFEQAICEAKSLWTYKLERKYVETLDETEETIFLPMLAEKFSDRKKFLTEKDYPMFGQPKYDGCLFHTTKIKTIEGSKTIKEIVENKISTKVLSYNEKEKIFEYKNIKNWFINGKSHYKNWIEIVPTCGPHIKCTLNHKILTENGWVEAKNLNSKKDKIFIENSEYQSKLIFGTLLGDSSIAIDKRHSGMSYRLIFSHTNKEYFDFKVKILNLEGKITNYVSGFGSKGWRFYSVAMTKTNFPINDVYYTGGKHRKCGKRKLITYNNLKKHLTDEGISLWIADDGSISHNNKNYHTPILSLSTHGHTESQINEFVKFFKKVWNCTPSIYVDKRVKENGNCPGQFLRFNTKDTLFILNKLRNKQIKGVEYKFYFPTENYITEYKPGFFYQNFRLRNSKRMPDAIQYDIEVDDNHNYIANNVVVHNCRSIAHWSKSEICLMSRGGKTYFLSHISEELEKVLPKDMFLDGELYIHGMPLQSINKLVRPTKNFNTDSIQVEYHVYDIGKITGSDKLSWLQRREMLKNFFDKAPNLNKVKMVFDEVIDNENDVYLYQSKCLENGFEGAIIRLPHGCYKFGYRSKDLLKVKSFQDDEFEIIDYTNGIGKFEKCIIYSCKTKEGKPFNVVPKGTFEDRFEWLKEGKKHIGKMLKVQFFAWTEDKIPQFPVGICIRLEEDM